MREKTDCDTPAEHHLHMCQLKGKPMRGDVEKLFDDPHFICANCGVTANRRENLCRPKPHGG